MAKETIDIRPGISVLGVLRHLNYKPWYALSEFVDNSLQSYLSSTNSTLPPIPLIVNIDIYSGSPSYISIRDNAYGIKDGDLERAFKAAALPPDNTGLSEFGMGMKSAACWFSAKWTVRTKAKNEAYIKTITFDIDSIVKEVNSEISIQITPTTSNNHFTEIVLTDLFHPPIKKTITKIKTHLTDIYRDFIRRNLLILKFNGEELKYNEPKILNTPYFKNPQEEPVTWKKDINFDFGDGLSVTGFAALRETGNTSQAGFSLFRRGRVIQGSGEDGYRPSYIFGSSNSFRYQRLFGELHLEGFQVSHTKDGFKWDNDETPFLEILKDHLENDLPLLKQADGYRAKTNSNKFREQAFTALNNSSIDIENKLSVEFPKLVNSDKLETQSEIGEKNKPFITRDLEIRFSNYLWKIKIELSNDESIGQWLNISDKSELENDIRHVNIIISLANPFMLNYTQNNNESLEAILKIAAAISISELAARDSGVKYSGTVRRNINEVLKNIFS